MNYFSPRRRGGAEKIIIQRDASVGEKQRMPGISRFSPRLGVSAVKVLLAMTAISAFSCRAETLSNYPDLPPAPQVQAALLEHPSVLAARAGIRAGEGARERLRAGVHETNVRLGAQQRSESGQQGESRQRMSEWDVGLERALRLPGKAEMDRKLGEGELTRSRVVYGDALHETGRALLKAWFAWGRENATATQWREQVAALREQLAIVAKRVQAGDAPKLEAGLAEAALASAESALHQATLKEQVAANELKQGYAGILLPDRLPLLQPVALEQGLDQWREEILKHSHELAVARNEAQLARMQGERAAAERTPDPALGLRAASERGGNERVVGVSISIPFSGAARSARAAETLAQAEAAAQREAAVLRKIRLEAANTYVAAQAAYRGWESATLAADKMRANAELLARAYALGEMSLSEVLLARRLALESALAATLARLEAAESRYRLLLDAHRLWPLDADDGEGHAHY